MAQQPLGIQLPRLSPAVKYLLIINAAVFLLLSIVTKATSFGVVLQSNLALSVGGLFSLKLWTLFTYAFVHNLGDIFHLLFNLLLLYFFGPTLENRWGTRRFVVFYAAGIFGGAILFLLVNLALGSNAMVVGASAAVLAIIIAWGMLFPNIPVYLFGILPLRGKHLILITIAVEILVAVSSNPTSSAAHFGGMITGALIISGYWRPSRLLQRLSALRPAPKRKKPKFTVVINPDDDDKAPPGGWVH